MRGIPSSPLARAAISFSMLLYINLAGSSKLTPVERAFVLTATVTTVTTLTPKGASSKRSVSVIAVTAAFDPV